VSLCVGRTSASRAHRDRQVFALRESWKTNRPGANAFRPLLQFLSGSAIAGKTPSPRRAAVRRSSFGIGIEQIKDTLIRHQAARKKE